MTDLNIDHIFSFYERRGYRHSVGKGARPALIVIDFSNAFTNGQTEFPGGNFANEIRQTRRMLEAGRAVGISIFYTTIAYNDPHKEAGLWGQKVPWLYHCKIGSRAVAIDPSLGALAEEPIIVKRFPSCFFETSLEAQLKRLRIDTIIFAGCTTSVCVRASAIDAMQRGFRALVVADAVGEFDPSLHAVHLKDLDSRYADVVNTNDVLEYLNGLKAHSGPDTGNVL
jgi:maleamate amidohydrolase